MTLLPATEDFMTRSLAALPGRWARLQYLASLRRNGSYEHWGMSRIYGQAVANRAMEDVHRELFLEILRTPVRELWRDAVQTARARATSEQRYVSELARSADSLLPANFGGGSVRHFNSVLLTLRTLAKRSANRPGA